MPGSLPGGSIAPGSRFLIRGVRLGNALRATTVTVRSGAHSSVAQLLGVTPREIEAILPRMLPEGEASLTVSRGGESSTPILFRVARSALGFYSVNHLGWGTAVAERVSGSQRRRLAVGNSAAPGDVVALTATGAAAGSHFRLFLGRHSAPILSAGPKANQAGNEELLFRVPNGTPEGCNVPVYAQGDQGAVSNIVTLPVARGGAACVVIPAWPVPTDPMGIVVLSRFSLLLERRPADWSAEDHEAGEAIFAAGTNGPLVMPFSLLPPAGTCTGLSGIYEPGSASAILSGLAFDASGAKGLDAGDQIEILGPAGRLNLVAASDGVYRSRISRRSPQTFLAPGAYRISSQGGAAVGPFAAELRAIDPLRWKNREQLAEVNRRQTITVEWNGADPQRPVLIAAVSVDRLTTAAYACLCVAPQGATSFAVPSAMLANLPVTQRSPGLPLSMLVLMQTATGGYAQFRTQGVPSGSVLYVSGSGRAVTVR